MEEKTTGSDFFCLGSGPEYDFFDSRSILNDFRWNLPLDSDRVRFDVSIHNAPLPLDSTVDDPSPSSIQLSPSSSSEDAVFPPLCPLPTLDGSPSVHIAAPAPAVENSVVVAEDSDHPSVTGSEQLSESGSKSFKKTCAICLGSMKPGHALFTAECSHTFHFNCISWLSDPGTGCLPDPQLPLLSSLCR